MTAHDPSLSDAALYGSALWVATRLGFSKDKFWRLRVDLEAQGFPPKDSLTNLWHKKSVDAWISARATVCSPEKKKNEQTQPNFDSL